jgi:putative DNA primase/helicase
MNSLLATSIASFKQLIWLKVETLMLKTTGEYGYKLPSSILLAPLKTGANPEIANLHQKFFVLVQEPDDNKKINTSTLKEITGDSTINARFNYSNICVVSLGLTLFIEANGLPHLDAVNDAVYRRVDVTPFQSKIVSQEDYDVIEDKTNLIVSNSFFKTDEFKEKYKLSLFHILRTYFKNIYKDKKITLSALPQEIKNENDKYLAGSDRIYEWFIKNYEPDTDGFVKLSDCFKQYKMDIITTNPFSRRKLKEFATKENFEEEIFKNLFIKKFVKLRNQNFNKKKVSNSDSEEIEELNTDNMKKIN